MFMASRPVRLRNYQLGTVCFLAAILFHSVPVHANLNGLEPLPLRPSSDSVHFFHVHDAYTLAPYYFTLGLQGDLTLDSTTLGTDTSNNPIKIADELFYLNVFASTGITEHLSAGVGVPIAIQQWRDGGLSGVRLASQGVSEIHLNAKWRLFDERDAFPGIAVVPSVNFPVHQTNYVIDSHMPVLNLEMAISKRLGSRFHSSLNLGYRLREGHTVPNTTVLIDDQFIYSLGLNYEFSRLNTWLITELHGSTVVNRFFKDAVNSPLELVVGPRLRPHPLVTLGAGAGYGLVRGIGNAKWRVFSVLSVNFNTREVVAKLVIRKHRIELPEKIYFEFNSDKIDRRSYTLLRDIAAVITTHGDLKAVILEGHTDSIGSDEYNLKLSGRRVESVRDFLVTLGIPPRMILAKSYGKKYPIATNETEEGRSINRRVEFRVVMEYENVERVFDLPPNDPYFASPEPSSK